METQINNENNNPPPTPIVENIPPVAPVNSGVPDNIFALAQEPVKIVEASEIIEKRGRGRPKGAKNKGAQEHEAQPTNAQTVNAGDVINESGGQSSTLGSTLQPQAENGTQPENIKPVDYQAIAGLTVGMGTSTLAMVFGPEWQPEDDNERMQLTIAIAAYMQSKGMSDIPPGALLAIVLLTYSAKRIHKPSTKTKIVAGWNWIKSKFKKKKPVLTVVEKDQVE